MVSTVLFILYTWILSNYYRNSLTVEIDSEVSKTEGRVGQTTNVVIGGTVTDDSTNEWLTLDQKVYYDFILLYFLVINYLLVF